MKNRIKEYYNIVKYLVDTENFKGIYFLTVITSIYGVFVLGSGAMSIFDMPLIALTFPIYNILLFCLSFFITFRTCHKFLNVFFEYMIRFNDKKTYCKNVILITVIVLLYFYLLFLLIFFSFSIFYKYQYINFTNLKNYSITNFSYMLFYICRYILYSTLFCILNILLYFKIKNGIYIVDVILLSGFFIVPSGDYIVKWYNIAPWNYYKITNYGSFSMEVLSSILFLIVLELLILIIYKNVYRGKKI